ncbi:unnamed protein product, partial [Prunus brigantina]
MLSLSSSPPFVFYFLLVFLLFHFVFLLLVLINVDSKTSPSCLSSFLSFCFVLFDIVVYSNSLEEHLEHLQKVFQVLRENQLYVKREKCSFVQEEVEFLGHKIRGGK